MLHVDEAHVCLVDESSGLKAVARALAGHEAPGNAVEFVLHERDEPLQRRLIAGSPCQEELRDLFGIGDGLILHAEGSRPHKPRPLTRAPPARQSWS